MNKIKQCIEENEKEFRERFMDDYNDLGHIAIYNAYKLVESLNQSQTKLIESIIEEIDNMVIEKAGDSAYTANQIINQLKKYL